MESDQQLLTGSGATIPETAPASEGLPIPRHIWRVLVVEDVPSQQKLLVTFFKKAGHAVAAADCGSAAIELVRQRPFDVVLMDVQMPGMNGLDAMRAIREAEEGSDRHVAIVAVTAHALAGDAEQCLAAGADAYLRKPIRLSELMELLNQLVGSE